MSKPRTHFSAVATTDVTRGHSACGIPASLITTTVRLVSCRLCLAYLARLAAEQRQVHERQYSGAADMTFMERTVRPLGPPTPQNVRDWREALSAVGDLITPKCECVPGAGQLDEHGREIAKLCKACATTSRPRRTSRPPRTGTAPFDSAPRALAELARLRRDGFATVSPNDPDRLERLTGALGSGPTTPSQGSRAITEADAAVHIEAALLAAFSGPFDDDAALTPERCRQLVMLRFVGLQSDNAPWTCAALSVWLSADIGREVAPGLVSRITRHGLAVVEAELVRRELCEAREGEVPMATTNKASTRDLHSWGAVAAHLGVSVRTAQRLAEAGMPVYRHANGRDIEARKAEVDAWWQAREDHTPVSDVRELAGKREAG